MLDIDWKKIAFLQTTAMFGIIDLIHIIEVFAIGRKGFGLDRA